MQALLDYSKEAWIAGKKGMYVMSDGTPEFFDLESLNHMESEYGIFVSDSGKDQDKLDTLKQLAQSMVQNGVPASTIAEMVDADSFSQIKEKIKNAEAQQQQLQQAQQEAEQQAQQQQAQLKAQELENENMNNEKDRQTKIKVAEIAAESRMAGDQLNMQKAMSDSTLKSNQASLKEKEHAEKIRSNQAKEQLIKEDQRQKASEKGLDRNEKAQDRALKQEDLRIKEKNVDKPKPNA